MKKCAVQIGIGLYLYDNDDPVNADMTYTPPSTAKKEELTKRLSESVNEKCSKAQVSTILKIIRENEINQDDVKSKYNVEKFSDMSKADAAEFIVRWKDLVPVIKNLHSSKEGQESTSNSE